jgi:hypothetical protein
MQVINTLSHSTLPYSILFYSVTSDEESQILIYFEVPANASFKANKLMH